MTGPRCRFWPTMPVSMQQQPGRGCTARRSPGQSDRPSTSQGRHRLSVGLLRGGLRRRPGPGPASPGSGAAGCREVAHTVVNTLAITSGIVCDGAKASCAAKIAIAVEAGILGYEHVTADGPGIFRTARGSSPHGRGKHHPATSAGMARERHAGNRPGNPGHHVRLLSRPLLSPSHPSKKLPIRPNAAFPSSGLRQNSPKNAAFSWETKFLVEP